MPHRAAPPPSAASALAAFDARIEALRRPGALEGWTGPVERIDTHISTLLLAGAAVWKFKRPVRLDFVDFSTLAARLQACRDELRLNRRTAPALYLGLDAVTDGDAGPVLRRLDEPDARLPPAAVDVAVCMRRFDDRLRFDRLAAAGALTGPMVDALAAAVAGFHAALPPAPSGHGAAPALRRTVRENLVELQAVLPAAADAATRSRVAALAAWSEARGAALEPLVEQRRREGCVREAHGDLHLGNLLWIDLDGNGPAAVAFDALEFSADLRHIDVAGDIAFAFMDLLAHGLPRLAWRFLSAVIEASGDHGGLPLVAWWASHRALVRAKVALLTAGDAALPDATARIALAARLAGLDPAMARPRLVAMYGLSGSGKSTVAGALAEALGAVRLRSDVERKRLFGLKPTDRPADDPAARAAVYGREAGRRTYGRLAALAEGALRGGVSVVVDAANLNRAERDAFRDVATRCGAAFTLLACTAAPEVLAQRVAARAAERRDASDATPEVLAFQQRIAQPPDAAEAADTCWLDTVGPAVDLERRVLALAAALHG